MKNNDSMVAKQKNVYILVDKDGYLVREDIQGGTRFRYPTTDEVGEYTAGYGLNLSLDNVFSIDDSVVAIKVNKQNIKNDDTVYTSGYALVYDSTYDVISSQVSLGTGSPQNVEIKPLSFSQDSLDYGELSTFENWVTFSTDVYELSVDNSISKIGEFPESLSGGLTHVFVRRVFKDSSGDVHEAISYNYSF